MALAGSLGAVADWRQPPLGAIRLMSSMRIISAEDSCSTEEKVPFPTTFLPSGTDLPPNAACRHRQYRPYALFLTHSPLEMVSHAAPGGAEMPGLRALLSASRNDARTRRVVTAERDTASRGTNAPIRACKRGLHRMKVATTRFYAGDCHIHPVRWPRSPSKGRWCSGRAAQPGEGLDDLLGQGPGEVRGAVGLLVEHLDADRVGVDHPEDDGVTGPLELPHRGE
jgi:hypothetical protein